MQVAVYLFLYVQGYMCIKRMTPVGDKIISWDRTKSIWRVIQSPKGASHQGRDVCWLIKMKRDTVQSFFFLFFHVCEWARESKGKRDIAKELVEKVCSALNIDTFPIIWVCSIVSTIKRLAHDKWSCGLYRHRSVIDHSQCMEYVFGLRVLNCKLGWDNI